VIGGPKPPGCRIGVIADTHGGLPAEAEAALCGVDAIVHAGDVGGGLVLELLAAIAPVTVVRGNSDPNSGSALWPLATNVCLVGVRTIVAHRAETLVGDLEPRRAAARVAIVGHTHVGLIERRDGVLWVNPGSPTAPRGGAAASVAIVDVGADGTVTGRLVTLR
jgi:uncharacterized protein